MSDRISSATKILLTLSVFFACATLGAGLALFTGWPVAILSGMVGFVSVQQLAASFARRRDKRAIAKEMAHLRKSNLEFETVLHHTRVRLGELDGMIEQRANHQEKKIVAELKVLETLMRDFAGKISRSAASVPWRPAKPQRGPTSAYLNTLGDKDELLETIRTSLEENRVDLYL
jgi:cyclic-di-GMP phosphodiesterase TipF (flagellum assembly factor)